ncbi:MAG: hypothetical protein LBV27_01650 [Oscillospiraceae bacterium]|jgi:hypothetical protein|nr:hypothetical protein [Oscillospiraceae bacterium]
MDTKLSGGDHAVDSRGIPIRLTGADEIIQRALIRLSVKKGAFAPDPGLGSELYRLAGCKSGDRDRVALGYIKEALVPLPQITVDSAVCTMRTDGALDIKIEAGIENGRYSLEVNNIE